MKLVKEVLTLIVFFKGMGISYAAATLLRGSDINDGEDVKIAAVEEEAKVKMAAVKEEMNMKIDALKEKEAIKMKALNDRERRSATRAPTAAATLEPCPAVPAGGCSICGDNRCISSPNAEVTWPGYPTVSCRLFQTSGYSGLVPLDQCSQIRTIPGLIDVCNCRDSVAPTATPIAPTAAPIAPTNAIGSITGTINDASGLIDDAMEPVYGGIWGDWKSWAGKTTDFYACGAELRFEDQCGSFCDDTAGNGLKLKFCRLDNWNSQITKTIGNGFWGDWKGMKMCPFGKYIGGARVRFEDSVGSGDDTALNGLEIRCVDRYWKGTEDIMVYSGIWGDWKPWVTSPPGKFVEDARVRIEDMLGSGDDTALNGIDFRVGNVPSPSDLPTPVCGVVEYNKYSGTASSIDTDGSGGFIPTTGDISIAVSLVPENLSLGSTVSIKTVCVLTAEDPTASAPFCTFETSLSLAGNGAIRDTVGTIIADGTPPALAITGGTRDFYGAYGEIITGGDFTFEQLGRDKIQLSFSATIDYCIPARGF